MKTFPSAMFFFLSFLVFATLGLLPRYFFRFPATVLRLPLRVRALVRVR